MEVHGIRHSEGIWRKDGKVQREVQLRRDRALNCFCGLLMLFVNMGILSTTFSTYFPYLRELRGFSNTGVYLLTTMRMIFALIVMANAERFYRIFDIRKGVMLTFLTAALSFAVLSIAQDNRLYYAATALFGVAYGLGGMIPASILLRRWYSPKESGLPIGIAATGSGVAGMIVPLQIHFLVERFGLTAAFVFQCAVILLLILPIWFLVKDWPREGEVCSRNPAAEVPENRAAGTAGSRAAAEPAAESGPESQSSALQTDRHADWRLFLGMILMGILGFSPSTGMSMLMRTTGHEMSEVALQLSLFGLYLIPSKIFLGRFADRFGGRRMLEVFLTLLTVSMFLFCFTGYMSFLPLTLTCLLFAVGVSVSSVGISIIAGDFSTEKTYAGMLENCQFFYAFGGLLFSAGTGMIADLTGSYIPAYAFFGVVTVFMLIIFLMEYRRAR